MTDQARKLALGATVQFDGREFTLTGGARVRGVNYYTFRPTQDEQGEAVHVMADEFWPRVDRGEATIL